MDEFQTSPFLGNNHINVPIQKAGRLYDWFVAGETICKNDSITYFNDSTDNSILDTEVNACSIIAIPSIEITFENDHIHVLYDLPKR